MMKSYEKHLALYKYLTALLFNLGSSVITHYHITVYIDQSKKPQTNVSAFSVLSVTLPTISWFSSYFLCVYGAIVWVRRCVSCQPHLVLSFGLSGFFSVFCGHVVLYVSLLTLP